MVTVGGAKVEVTVLVDIKEIQKLQKVGFELKKIEGAAASANRGLKQTGDQAAASAVRFQTLTQGAINLTTAFIQTETTISNLTKAKTSLKAAMVGVSRAEDLLARKTLQLREEQAKSVPNLEKIKLLNGEIVTGYKDLEVKNDRVRDQTDQLNDTYKLFTLNLLNVSFSAIQTGKAMADSVPKIKEVTKAIKLSSLASKKYALVALALVAAYEILIGQVKIFGEEAAKTYSISGNLNKIFGDMEVSIGDYSHKIEDATEGQLKFNKAVKGTRDELKFLEEPMKLQLDFLSQLSDVSGSVKVKTAIDLINAYTGKGGTRQGFSPGTTTVVPTHQKGVNSNVQTSSTGTSFNTDGTTSNDKIEVTNEIFDNWIKSGVGAGPTAFPKALPGVPSFMLPSLLIAQQARINNGTNILGQNVTSSAQPTSLPKAVSVKSGFLSGFNIDPLGTSGVQGVSNLVQFVDEHERTQIDAYNNGRLAIFSSTGGIGPSSFTLDPTFRIMSDDTKLTIFSQIQHQGGIIDRFGRLIPLDQVQNNLILKELQIIASHTGQPDSNFQFNRDTSLRARTQSEISKDLKDKFQRDFMQGGIDIAGGGIKYSVESSRGVVPNTFIDPRAADILKQFSRPRIVKNTSFYEQVNKLRGSAINDFFSNLDNPFTQRSGGTDAFGRPQNIATFFAGIGGEIIARQAVSLGLSVSQLRASGNALSGFFGQNSRIIKELEKAQLEDQRINGIKVPRPHLIAQGFRPADVGSFVRAGRVRVFMENQGVNSSNGSSISATAKGAVWQDFGIQGGAARFEQRNEVSIRHFANLAAVRDENLNRLRNGGSLREGYNMGDLYDPNAVQGGFKSLAAYRVNQKIEFWKQSTSAAVNLSALGMFFNIGVGRPSVANINRQRAISQAASIGSLFQRTGFGLSSFGVRKTGRGGGYVLPGNIWDAHRRSVIASNQRAMAMASQVDILQGGFGLSGFMGGGGLDLSGLQLKVAEQDAMIRSIGLNRTEAFRIIDIESRGRDEIDDRVLWTQRNASISTGVAVI